MRVPHPQIVFRQRFEFFLRKLAQQFVHFVATILAVMQQRLVHEGQQQRGSRIGHGARRIPAKTGAEDRQPCQHALFFRRQALPGGLEYHAHAAVAGGHVAHCGGKEVYIAPNLSGDLTAGHCLAPRGGQLDAQRQRRHVKQQDFLQVPAHDAGLDRRQFDSGVDERAVHERFWADDLVYTSSSGSRFGKQQILDGIDGADAAEPAPAYTAEDVDIRVYDDMAVVAFRLVATAADGSVEEYFNTGTFANRDGRWQAVANQFSSFPE